MYIKMREMILVGAALGVGFILGTRHVYKEVEKEAEEAYKEEKENIINSITRAYASNKRPFIHKTVGINSRFNFDHIVFSSRDEAQAFLSALLDTIEDYGHVTVSEVLGLLGVRNQDDYSKYGWTKLSTAMIVRGLGGYVLVLPKSELISQEARL
jgi:hypothetical protein